MPSGHRVEIPARASLLTSDGRSGNVHEVWAVDGFSRLQPIVVSFGVAVDGTSLPKLLEDPAQTAAKGYHTAIIDAETGTRVAHFGDVDPRANDPAREALVLHVIEPMKPRTRYVVALSSIRRVDGELVEPPEAFRRLRDGAVGDDPVLKPLLARYEKDIFPVLEKDGLLRENLQLAWDFTTASDERVFDDMLTARAVALAELQATPPQLEIEAFYEGETLASLLEGDSTAIWRMVTGYLTGPRVVDSDRAGATLTRGADGKVILNGTTRFPFTALIPVSVRDRFAPSGVMLFGHGFFGSRSELEGTAARNIAAEAGRVAIAIDWQGMSDEDIGQVVQTVGGDVARSIAFGERVMQAMVNWNTLSHAIQLGLFHEQAVFLRPTSPANAPGILEDPANPGTTNAGASVLDEQQPLGFVGISMGHLLGGTLAALNPDIERSVFLVGGGAVGTMMFRARPFTRFLFLLDLSMPDPLDQRLLAAMMQSQFDRFDPAIFGPYVLNQELPLGPSSNPSRRRVLEMYGIGDTQVPNIGSEIHARSMGLPLLTPSVEDGLYGMESRTFPVEGSGTVVYDLGIDPSFYADAEPVEEGNIVHEGVRRVPEAVAQIRTFLGEGKIVDTCDGPCTLDVSGLDIPE